VDSIANLVETYSSQPQFLRAYILTQLIMRLSMPYNNARQSISSDLSLEKLIYAKYSDFLH
jgi:hypothetical protein